jgi:hypothetical protein
MYILKRFLALLGLNISRLRASRPYEINLTPISPFQTCPPSIVGFYPRLLSKSALSRTYRSLRVFFSASEPGYTNKKINNVTIGPRTDFIRAIDSSLIERLLVAVSDDLAKKYPNSKFLIFAGDATGLFSGSPPHRDTFFDRLTLKIHANIPSNGFNFGNTFKFYIGESYHAEDLGGYIDIRPGDVMVFDSRALHSTSCPLFHRTLLSMSLIEYNPTFGLESVRPYLRASIIAERALGRTVGPLGLTLPVLSHENLTALSLDDFKALDSDYHATCQDQRTAIISEYFK